MFLYSTIENHFSAADEALLEEEFLLSEGGQLVGLAQDVLQLVLSLLQCKSRLLRLVELVADGVFGSRKNHRLELGLLLALEGEALHCLAISLPAL